jgi:hypothetical protein
MQRRGENGEEESRRERWRWVKADLRWVGEVVEGEKGEEAQGGVGGEEAMVVTRGLRVSW